MLPLGLIDAILGDRVVGCYGFVGLIDAVTTTATTTTVVAAAQLIFPFALSFTNLDLLLFFKVT